MTPTIDNSEFAERQTWAMNRFGLPPDAVPAEICSAVLEHLDEVNLVPETDWRQAIWLLCDPQAQQAWPTNGHDAFRAASESKMAEEIDIFATQFFKLPCNARKEKWTQLRSRVAAFPRLRLRLANWERGLDVYNGNLATAEPQVKLLAERVCSLFTLKPAAQETQRREWLAEMQGDWRAAVRLFRAHFSKLAALDVDFLNGLDSYEGLSAKAGERKLLPGLVPAIKPASISTSLNKKSPSKTSSGLGRYGYVIGILLVTALRVALNSSPNPTPNYRLPSIPKAPDAGELQRIRDAQKRADDSFRTNPFNYGQNNQPTMETPPQEELRRWGWPPATPSKPTAAPRDVPRASGTGMPDDPFSDLFRGSQ
jgi:hypothetical protein